MSIANAYSTWSVSYDSDRNWTRDLDAEVTRRLLTGTSFPVVIEAGCGTGKNTGFFCDVADEVAGGSPVAVWLSEGRIRLGQMGQTGRTNGGDRVRAVSEPGRKANHPVLVPLGGSGSLLVAWTEGTAWQRGGDLAWRTVGSDASQDSPVQRLPGVPVWGSVTAWRESDGHVTVLY